MQKTMDEFKNRHYSDFFLRILVVDDEPGYLKLFRKLAKHFGHEMTGVTDPVEAVRLVEESYSQGNPFDAAIIDFLMPHYNGVETARKIEKIDPRLIKIAITRDKSLKTKQKIIDSLAFRLFIPKGTDIKSWGTLFNYLLNTKIRQYSEKESRFTGKNDGRV